MGVCSLSGGHRGEQEDRACGASRGRSTGSGVNFSQPEGIVPAPGASGLSRGDLGRVVGWFLQAPYPCASPHCLGRIQRRHLLSQKDGPAWWEPDEESTCLARARWHTWPGQGVGGHRKDRQTGSVPDTGDIRRQQPALSSEGTHSFQGWQVSISGSFAVSWSLMPDGLS